MPEFHDLKQIIKSSKSISVIKRQKSAEQLRELSPQPEVLATLEALFDDSAKHVRKAAIESLVSYGTDNAEVRKYIERATKSSDPQVREIAHICLSESNPEQTKKYFLQQLQLKSAQKRIVAIEALSPYVHDDDVINNVATLLDDKSLKVRVPAALMLLRAGNENALDFLCRALHGAFFGSFDAPEYFGILHIDNRITQITVNAKIIKEIISSKDRNRIRDIAFLLKESLEGTIDPSIFYTIAIVVAKIGKHQDILALKSDIDSAKIHENSHNTSFFLASEAVDDFCPDQKCAAYVDEIIEEFKRNLSVQQGSAV